MNILKSILSFCGYIWSVIWPLSLRVKYRLIVNAVYTGYLRKYFQHLGKNSYFSFKASTLQGLNYICIGNNTVFGKNLKLTAWLRVENMNNPPNISIGDYCNFGDNAHITAIKEIHIGNHVLTGPNVLITDNSHGNSTIDHMDIPPMKRPVVSRGGVKIDDNVWIGANTSIMQNVYIGKGSIIGANSVVTKDIPPYSVAAGIPAKIIKTLTKDET